MSDSLAWSRGTVFVRLADGQEWAVTGGVRLDAGWAHIEPDDGACLSIPASQVNAVEWEAVEDPTIEIGAEEEA